MTNHPRESGLPERTDFPHFMLKEIYEQPHTIQETIRVHVNGNLIFHSSLEMIESVLLNFKKIIIAASGSSRHAGLAGEIMIEDLSGVAVDVEYASEYCYRSTHASADPLVVVITQSGETADTIAAQREALNRAARTVAISNVANSTIANEANATLITQAGLEKAVPATKSFTAQLTILYLFALFIARKRGRMTSEVIRTHLNALSAVPQGIEKYLGSWDKQADECSWLFQQSKTFIFLGRGVHYAIAREGALKLKEISYVQAEAFPAGELRHGPNAMVDEKLTVVALATRDAADPDSMLRYKKTFGVLEYVKSHGGKSVVIATDGDNEIQQVAERVIFVPPAPELLLPLLEVVPLQLFSYHYAVRNGCDVDHPRHLVKAVVTE
jgi:glucosamine--fructose-6-phosphate aminotransferase (isomerizing)